MSGPPDENSAKSPMSQTVYPWSSGVTGLVLAAKGVQPASWPICWLLWVKRGAGLSGPSDENRTKSPVPSGESRESTSKSSDITGLFWLTRVSSPRINMPKSSVEKRGGSVQAFVWKQGLGLQWKQESMPRSLEIAHLIQLIKPCSNWLWVKTGPVFLGLNKVCRCTAFFRC